VAVVFRQSIPSNIRTDKWISVLKDRHGLFSAYRQCLPKAHVKQKRSFTGLLNVQFHHWMDFPHSVVRHVLSTVVLLFRSMAYVPVRFPNYCNDRRLTEGQLLRSVSVKRKPCGSPTKNGCANLTPLWFCRYLTDNDAGFVTSRSQLSTNDDQLLP
jgi:hypothetical protein